MSWNLNYTFPSESIGTSLMNALSNFYSTESDFTGLGPFDPNNNTLNEISNFMTAGITLVQWWDLNQFGNYNGPGTSQDNPYEVPFTETQRSQIIASLGGSADTQSIKFHYYDKTKYNSAVGNTYFNLNSDPAYGFVGFEDNKLVIRDVYNFEGMGDWGIAPTESLDKARLSGGLLGLVRHPEFLPWLIKTFAVIIVMMPAGTDLAKTRQMMIALGYNPNTGTFADGTDVQQIKDTLPYTSYTRDHLNNAIGNVANLYIKNEFTADEICQHNPELYRDAVSKGFLKANATAAGSCSNISQQAQCFDASDNVVEVGAAQPSPLLQLPSYSPRVMVIGSNPNSWNVGTNDRYPSPFTSFQQQITNNLNFLGPYAMWGPIAGRICLIVGGVNSGQKGFIAQCWDDFDDGNYNRDADNIQYSSKKDWWDNTRKVEVIVPNLLFSGRPMTPVKVAVESFDGPGADNVWGPNWPIWSSPLGSVNLSALIPLVVITSRYF